MTRLREWSRAWDTRPSSPRAWWPIPTMFTGRPRPASLCCSETIKLTDDIGFRFSSHSWEEYPLTADKYATWLAATPGQCINIFCDYETFGEHQWADTGIFEFLRVLPEEVLRHENLRFATPAEIARDIAPERELSVPNYVSWADLERDTSCWLGNALQQACFIYQKRLEAPVKESRDQELLQIWRTLRPIRSSLLHLHSWRGPGRGAQLLQPLRHPL